MDIRECTGIIIKKDGKFLVGKCPITGVLMWSDSPYEAWRTRKRDKAFMVAEKVGGVRYLFNPPSGQLREMVVD